MTYLDTLIENLAQVNKTFVPARELIIGAGTKMGAISIGYGTLDGVKIYIAKKIPRLEDMDLVKRFLTDLWFIDRFEKAAGDYSFEGWRDYLPKIHGIAFIGTEPQYILTEDYLQRNSRPISVPEYKELDPILRGLLFAATLTTDIDEIRRVCFRIGKDGPMKLGDFEPQEQPSLEGYIPFLDRLKFLPNPPQSN